MVFSTLNVVDGTDKADLRDLLAAWSDAAAKMTLGQLVGDGRRSSTRRPSTPAKPSAPPSAVSR